MKNNQAILDTRKLMTGKDGKLFVEAGGVNVFLAEVDTFTVQMNTTNQDYQPVGSILSFAIPTGVSFTLTLTEAVVRDDVIMAPILEAISNGFVPSYNFQGAMERYDGGEQRMVFNNATPDGTIDLMNLTPGEILKRNLNFRLNDIPKYLKTLVS